MNKNSGTIVSIGVINIDFIVEVGNDQIGGKHIGKNLSVTAGGHGSSLPIAVSRSGSHSIVLGQLGDDSFGHQILDTLRSEHVNCDYLQFSPSSNTGVAMIMVNPNGETTYVDFLGANLEVDRKYIDSCADILKEADLVTVHIGPGVSMSEPAHRMIQIASAADVPILGTFSYSAALNDEILGKINWLVLNMNQAASLCGLEKGTPRNARIAAGILAPRVLGDVVIQMDSDGVLIVHDGIMTILDSCPDIRPIDTAGTTDFFAGVFAAELQKGASLTDAAIKAHKAAMLCTQKIGVYTSFPTTEVLKSL